MWVAKPIYESLPYVYLLLGALSLTASMSAYVNYWYWPSICFAIGVLGLVAGLAILLKRRDYRATDRRSRQ